MGRVVCSRHSPDCRKRAAGSPRTVTRKPFTAASIWAAVLILALPIMGYVAGYFWLGKWEFVDAFFYVRTYRWPWLVTIYKPAGWIESQFVGRRVYVLPTDPP